MACGARWGLKLGVSIGIRLLIRRLNGLWSPLGIEALYSHRCFWLTLLGLNGLWSPLGIEALTVACFVM